MPHTVPTVEHLTRHACRQLAGASLVVLAAVVVTRTGYVDQRLQYVAIAAALGPQLLLDVLAVADKKRRQALRLVRRPQHIPLLAAMLLFGLAAYALVQQAHAPAVAALCAAAGLGIAAAPEAIEVSARA